MVGQMFDVICKQQNIALDTEVATIDPDVFVDFVIGLEDLLDIKVDLQSLQTITYIRDLKNYFEHMAIERSLLCAKVSWD